MKQETHIVNKKLRIKVSIIKSFQAMTKINLVENILGPQEIMWREKINLNGQIELIDHGPRSSPSSLCF